VGPLRCLGMVIVLAITCCRPCRVPAATPPNSEAPSSGKAAVADALLVQHDNTSEVVSVADSVATVILTVPKEPDNGATTVTINGPLANANAVPVALILRQDTDKCVFPRVNDVVAAAAASVSVDGGLGPTVSREVLLPTVLLRFVVGVGAVNMKFLGQRTNSVIEVPRGVTGETCVKPRSTRYWLLHAQLVVHIRSDQ